MTVTRAPSRRVIHYALEVQRIMDAFCVGRYLVTDGSQVGDFSADPDVLAYWGLGLGVALEPDTFIADIAELLHNRTTGDQT